LQGLFFPRKWQKSVLWSVFFDAKSRTRSNPKTCSRQNVKCIFTPLYAAMPVAPEPSKLYFCSVKRVKKRELWNKRGTHSISASKNRG
jgi:hypothetical protein